VNRPRVVHIVPNLFGYEGVYGGAERFALELARAMAERFPTTLVAFGATPISRRDGSLRVEVVRNLVPYRRFRFDPIGPMMIPHISKSDVIHYHQTHTMMASVALLLGRLTGRRVFTTHLGGGGFGLHRIINVDKWYDGHLHISQFSREIFGHAVSHNAGVIYGGVDVQRFSPGILPPSRDYVLYVGRLLPHKGIDYLIEGIPPDIPLIIAGRPMRHAAKYYTLLHELAQGKNVQFVQDADDERLIQLYRNARCIVLPSVYQSRDGAKHSIPELLGLTLIEGMACGTPGICTSVASLPEVVENGVSGFVVPPNNPVALSKAITALWSDSSLVHRMGDAARRRVLDMFTWQAVVDRCLHWYGV
jgi:glycosyltransferase involved in cell wall biosynthesis